MPQALPFILFLTKDLLAVCAELGPRAIILHCCSGAASPAAPFINFGHHRREPEPRPAAASRSQATASHSQLQVGSSKLQPIRASCNNPPPSSQQGRTFELRRRHPRRRHSSRFFFYFILVIYSCSCTNYLSMHVPCLRHRSTYLHLSRYGYVLLQVVRESVVV
jgi:hypothetical protein